MDIDEFEASQNGGEPEADIETAVNTSTAIDEPVLAPDNEPIEPEATPEVIEPEVIEPQVVPVEPDKKVQTPEENARFAEERRQRQAEERAKTALEELKKSDPAFQAAKLLEEIYGAPISQIQSQLQRARIEQLAQQQNIPVEAAERIDRAEKETAQAGQELVQVQFAAWEARMGQEGIQLKQQYPVLSDDDLQEAQSYILNTARNPNLPLHQAVMAVHGQKITDAIRQAAKNEALAEISGRKQTPIPPQGGKPSSANSLTAEEKYVAKQMGISEEDYLKYK